MSQSRQLHIDTLRGIACFLLVSYHVVGPNPSSGLEISSGWLRELNDLLVYLRMPLFTFLSGVVYAYRPFIPHDMRTTSSYLRSKARRLLVPMLTIGTLFAAVRTLTSNSPEAAINWATIHIYPVAHFWFVEAIFIIFLITLILEAIRILDRPLGVAVALTVSCGIYLTNVQIKIFALDGVAYLLPYFFAGMLVQRHFQSLIGQYKYALPILIAGVLCLTQLSQYQMSVETRMLPLALVASTLLCTSLLLIRIQHPFIARIGVYSYSIYIFHIFFTAASRIVLQKTGIEDKTIMFVIGLGAGLIGPIVAELVLKRTVITRKLLLGQR